MTPYYKAPPLLQRLVRAVQANWKHTRWPLGAEVEVTITDDLSVMGKINKHDEAYGWSSCAVALPRMLDGRYCHRIRFSQLRLVDKSLRWKLPWYRKSPWAKN